MQMTSVGSLDNYNQVSRRVLHCQTIVQLFSRQIISHVRKIDRTSNVRESERNETSDKNSISEDNHHEIMESTLVRLTIQSRFSEMCGDVDGEIKKVHWYFGRTVIYQRKTD